jgi:hypothetical protein
MKDRLNCVYRTTYKLTFLFEIAVKSESIAPCINVNPYNRLSKCTNFYPLRPSFFLSLFHFSLLLSFVQYKRASIQTYTYTYTYTYKYTFTSHTLETPTLYIIFLDIIKISVMNQRCYYFYSFISKKKIVTCHRSCSHVSHVDCVVATVKNKNNSSSNSNT